MPHKLLVVGISCAFLTACATSPDAAAQQPAPKPAEQVAAKFGAARHAPDARISQVPSPDSRLLSILFSELQAKTDTHALGAAQAGEVLLVPIEGSGTVSVKVDARGDTMIKDGECELTMMTPDGGTQYWSTGEGRYSQRLAMDFQLPAILKLVISAYCFAKPTEGAVGLLSVDSLDLALEAPDNQPVTSR